MHGDDMPGGNQPGAADGLREIHGIDAVNRQDGVIQPPLRHAGHLPGLAGIARKIDGFAVHSQNITDALLPLVMVVVGFHGFRHGKIQPQGPVFAVFQRVRALPDDAARLPGRQLGAVVVGVLVRHQNQVCRGIVACSGKRVNVNHVSAIRGDAQTPVPLIQ